MTYPTLETLKNRRSHYAIGRNATLSNDEIEALIKDSIRLSPSSFNSQSSRAVILFGEASDKFWSIVTETLRAIVPAEAFEATDAKMKAFSAGLGTVLFYEDQATIKGLQENFPLYAAAFPGFSEHSTGMAQLSVWNALSDAGLGASLQHYHPIIDAAVAEAFNIPDSWKLCAQLPFGSVEGEPREKSFIADDGRFVTLTKAA